MILNTLIYTSIFRYRQFAKLLSRLVRHSVQYVSDMHALFKLVIRQTIISVFNKNVDMQLFYNFQS